MLEDLSAASQRVLEIADEEAARLNHDFTGTEHILLGLVLCDDTVVSPLLAKHGVRADDVRARLASASGFRAQAVDQKRALTARAKQVMSLAEREADSLGDDDVRPEHLLLGIIRQQTGVAALVLSDGGVDLEELRAEVLAITTDEIGEGTETTATLFDGNAEFDGDEAHVHPTCPNCGKQLSEVLAVTNVAPVGTVPARRRSTGQVSVVFCSSCGHTLSVSR